MFRLQREHHVTSPIVKRHQGARSSAVGFLTLLHAIHQPQMRMATMSLGHLGKEAGPREEPSLQRRSNRNPPHQKTMTLGSQRHTQSVFYRLIRHQTHTLKSHKHCGQKRLFHLAVRPSMDDMWGVRDQWTQRWRY